MLKTKKDFTVLPDSELKIMLLIWEMEKRGVEYIHAKSLIAAYSEVIGHLALTTILTLITRLQQKGFIRIEKRGGRNCASSVVGEGEYKSRLTETFVQTVFKNDRRTLLCTLFERGIIDDEDIADFKKCTAKRG